jgi:uncharacterized protein (DUF305 family)
MVVGVATQSTMDHSKMGKGSGSGSGAMATPAAAGMSPSSKAFADVNEKMHKDMAITLSGDADVDFFKGMIPHHQGAIDMANVVLKYGKNSETKKLAEEIIKAQETEIAFMKAWLIKNEKK